MLPHVQKRKKRPSLLTKHAMFCLTTPGIRNMLLRELPMALPFPMTLLLLLTDKTLLEDVPQDTQQNHKGVQAIHGAPILREIRLMDGPLEKRLFGPLGIPQDNSIPTLQALLQAELVPRAALTRILLRALIPTLILLVPPTPVAQATILLAACSTCSFLKKKHLKTF